jgi:hypothetical protein
MHMFHIKAWMCEAMVFLGIFLNLFYLKNMIFTPSKYFCRQWGLIFLDFEILAKSSCGHDS